MGLELTMLTHELNSLRFEMPFEPRPGLEPDYAFLEALPEKLADRIHMNVYEIGYRADGSRQVLVTFGSPHAHVARGNTAYQDQLFDATQAAWDAVAALTGQYDTAGNLTFPHLVVLTEGRVRKPDTATPLRQLFDAESGEIGAFEALARRSGVPDENFRCPEPGNEIWRYLADLAGPQAVNAYLGLRMYSQLIAAGLDQSQITSAIITTLHRRYGDFSHRDLAAHEMGFMGLQRAWEKLYPGEQPLYYMPLNRLARLALEQTSTPMLRWIPKAERSAVQNIAMRANVIRDIHYINAIGDLLAAGHDVVLVAGDTHLRAIHKAMQDIYLARIF
jgi:hypothetical protein